MNLCRDIVSSANVLGLILDLYTTTAPRKWQMFVWDGVVWYCSSQIHIETAFHKSWFVANVIFALVLGNEVSLQVLCPGVKQWGEPAGSICRHVFSNTSHIGISSPASGIKSIHQSYHFAVAIKWPPITVFCLEIVVKITIFTSD